MITMRPRLMFFDSKIVMSHMDRAQRQALSKIGAFVRRRSRTSMKKNKKGISRPGKAPHSHAGDIRRLLFFAVGPDFDSVVIGPLRYKKGEAPNLLEFGGATVRQRVTTRGKRGPKKVAIYKKHPFMGPALEAEVPTMSAKWRNSVGGN